MPAAGPVPPRRGTSIVVWILLGIAGLFVIGVLGFMGAVYWFARNPVGAIARIVNAANPDAEVLNVDNENRRVTIRNRRDGKEVTLSLDDVKNGRITFSATDENGKTGQVEIGAGSGQLPSWVPVYPGARIESHINGSGVDDNAMEEGGMYTFASSDQPAQVLTFYQDKARDLGMKVEMTTATSDAGHFTAADDDGKRSMVVLVGSGSGSGATGTVTFKRKR